MFFVLFCFLVVLKTNQVITFFFPLFSGIHPSGLDSPTRHAPSSSSGPELKRARVLYDFDAADSTELNLQADEVYLAYTVKAFDEI